jgi:hypothetical protein
VNENNPAFAMMPLPMLFGGAQQPQHHNEEAPARVRVGLAFLRDLTMKTMTRGMANDVGFDVIEGQKLEVEEREAQSAACKMLTSYFQGKLKPTDEERACMQPMGVGQTNQCFHCLASGGVTCPNCRVCNGSGQVIIYAGTK